MENNKHNVDKCFLANGLMFSFKLNLCEKKRIYVLIPRKNTGRKKCRYVAFLGIFRDTTLSFPGA